MARTLEVTDLKISPRVAAKILLRGIHADEVRATVEEGTVWNLGSAYFLDE